MSSGTQDQSGNEDVVQRIVAGFHEDLDVSKDAWKFAESSDIGQFNSWFDVYLNPTRDEALELLEAGDFECWERYEEICDDPERMTDEEYAIAVERYFRPREHPDLRIHTKTIEDRSGRSAVVAIHENPLFEWEDVTVHLTYTDAMDCFRPYGQVRPPDWQP